MKMIVHLCYIGSRVLQLSRHATEPVPPVLVAPLRKPWSTGALLIRIMISVTILVCLSLAPISAQVKGGIPVFQPTLKINVHPIVTNRFLGDPLRPVVITDLIVSVTTAEGQPIDDLTSSSFRIYGPNITGELPHHLLTPQSIANIRTVVSGYPHGNYQISMPSVNVVALRAPRSGTFIYLIQVSHSVSTGSYTGQ